MITSFDLANLDDWLRLSYPYLPLDGDEVSLDLIIDSKDHFFSIVYEDLYDIDRRCLENNYSQFSLSNVEGKFFIEDIRNMVMDILTTRYQKSIDTSGRYGFIFQCLGRGILEPFFFINTLIEYIVVSTRDPRSDIQFRTIESLGELDNRVFSKIVLSILCSLRTSLKRDMNVLQYQIDTGGFSTFQMRDILDLFSPEDRLFQLLAEVYNALFNQIHSFPVTGEMPFSISVENNPDRYELKNKSIIYKIHTAR